MTSQKKHKVLTAITEYLLMAFGCACYGFAWQCIIKPAQGIGGGASGLALVIQELTHGVIPMGYGFFLINTVLIVAAMIMVGVKFGIKTIYCIVMISVALNFFGGSFGVQIPPNLFGIDQDLLLSTILGAVVSAFGVSICFREGGSTGGTDIIWMIINSFKTISYGKVLIATDCLIIASSYIVYHSIPTIIYGFVMVAVFGYTVDVIQAGSKQSSQILVFSKHYQEIADSITKGLHRGVTIIDGVGAYTNQPSKMLIVICRKFETDTILKLIREYDPHAFLSVGAVMGVYGQGFENLPALKQAALSRKQNKVKTNNNETV